MASFQQLSIQSRIPAPPPPASTSQDVFTVRIPRDKNRKFSIMKFGTGSSVDFAKVGEQSVKMERENNLREYRSANDLDTMPKFGAGSEYGRDQKEESRRKKYGIMLKKYNPDDQPWNLKIGSGKQAKRYKGVREGTISENTSYYIFTKAPDGAFEAYPVDEWYNFSPIVKYKYLNSDEAEEEFSRRDKTLNYFSIMVKKRLKKEEDLADDEEEGIKGMKKSKKKNKRDLVLTDMEDWDDLKMSEDDDDDDDRDGDDDDDGAAKKKKKPKGGSKRAVKNSKKNSDDEAVEESDDGDSDDKEVDYMSDSGSDDSLSGPEAEEKGKSKYDEKGVDQEDGLRNILDSGAEDEEEQQEEEEEDADKEEERLEEPPDAKKEKKKGEDNSSSSSSDDDSDIEKDAKLASDIFLQPQRSLKPTETDTNVATSSVAEVAPSDKSKEKGLKRKAEKSGDGKAPSTKKHKSDASEGISEDAIRRYLMRKPMTTKDLLTKFKAKKLNMTNERMTHVIAQILKRINPEKQTINKVLYLSIKKPE